MFNLVWSGLYSFIANLAIGLFVYSKNPKRPVNIFFGLFSLTVSGWSFGSFLENIIPDKNLALWVLRFNYLFALWLPSLYIHFVYALTGISSDLNRVKLKLAYLFSVLLSPIVFTPWFIEKLRVIKGTNFYISSPGPLYYLFFGFFAVGMCEVLFHTLSRIKKSGGRRQTQLKYITIANAIAIFAGFEYFSRVFGFFSSPPLDDYILVIYLLVLAYAIVRHHLLDIEVIIKKTLVFAGLFAMVMAIVGAVTTLTQSYISQYLVVSQRVSTAISVLFVILLYDPTRKFLVHATDKYLFQKKKSIKEILTRLSNNVITILDIDKVGETILSTLRETLRLTSGAIILKDEDGKSYSVIHSFNIKGANAKYDEKHFFIQSLVHRERMINLENQEDKTGLPQPLLDELEKLNSTLCIPLFLHQDLIGVLNLGKKKSDEEFTAEELDYFPTVSSQVAIALSNARLYDILKKSQADFAQQAKMAAIGTLSAGIGHEIKNPLAAIKTGVEMIKFNKKLGVYNNLDRVQYEAIVDDVIERIVNNVTRATAVMDRLSGFAKKPKEFVIESVSLEKAMEETLHFLENEFQHYGILIRKEYAPSLPHIQADTRAVEDAFLNILVNARHAIKEKGSIKITTFRLDGEAGVSIQDTGSGISKENLEKIFDPFFTTKDTTRNSDPASIKGTGLGLFIVRETIKKFGGRITVNSEVGRGTTFQIFFPIPSPPKA